MNREPFFRLANGRRFGTILVLLALVGGCGLALAALLGDEVDVPAFFPAPGPDRPSADSPEASRSGGAVIPAAFGIPEIRDAGNQAEGETVRFGPYDEGVLVVPDGWTRRRPADDHLLLGNDSGVSLALSIVQATTDTPATQLVTEVQSTILSPRVASHVRTSDVLGLQPFGSLVTRSNVGYSALRIDTQGVSSVGGNIFVFVREDGLALVVNVEVTPAEHWEARTADWLPLWASAVSNFAGASVLA